MTRPNRVAPLAAACFLVAAAAQVHAVPVTFTVDTAASNLGDTSIPLTGTLTGDFDVFDRTFTFSAGSIAAPPSAGTATMPPTLVFDDSVPIVGSVEVTASGTATFDLPALNLAITSGAVTDGGTTAGVSTTSVDGLGSASGQALLHADGFLLNATETLDFSATGHPALSFDATHTLQLTDAGGGARLALPIHLSATDTEIDLVPQADGVLANFPLVEPFVTDFIADQLALPGLLVATSTTALPALPDAVSYAVDPVQSIVSAGPLSTSLGGTVAGQYYQGTLDFAGGSNIVASLGAGTSVAPITGSALGFDYGITVDSVSLDLVFDLLSGRVTDGSPVSALDAILAQGALAVTGHATFESLLTEIDSPFTITSALAFDLDLLNSGATIGLVNYSGIETLTIPLAYSLASYDLSNTVVDYDDDGFIEALATFLSSTLAPRILTQSTAALPLTDYTGTLVATRAIRDTGPPTQVPEPPTWLLLGAAVPLLALRRFVSLFNRDRGT